MWNKLSYIQKFIDKNGLLQKGDHYLVALSGGADSVALLRILLDLGYKVDAAHCNFRLRGDESDRDEAFCRELCKDLGVEIHVAHFDTKTYAELHRVSIEMAARELRYNYFRQLRYDLQLDGICVAHHKDDSVETVLLNMLRGTGIEGLKGIIPDNGEVLRPLLCVTRCEIVDYLLSVGQLYVVDSSNLVDEVKRNRLRLDVIPELEKVSPAAKESIVMMSENIQSVLPLLEYAVSQLRDNVVLREDDTLVISVSRLLETPSSHALLWYLLRDKGFNSIQVGQIADHLPAESGKSWLSPTHELVIDRDCIIVEPINSNIGRELRIPEVGIYVYNDGYRFDVRIETVDEQFIIPKTANVASLDAEKVSFPLTVRNVKEGDWFVPFGMKGRKLLSDFMTDRKLSLFEKRRQLVLTDASANIIWVVGMRPDGRYCVSTSTSKALVIRL